MARQSAQTLMGEVSNLCDFALNLASIYNDISGDTPQARSQARKKEMLARCMEARNAESFPWIGELCFRIELACKLCYVMSAMLCASGMIPCGSDNQQGLSFNDLHEEQKAAADILGWTPETWDSDSYKPTTEWCAAHGCT